VLLVELANPAINVTGTPLRLALARILPEAGPIATYQFPAAAGQNPEDLSDLHHGENRGLNSCCIRLHIG
jgi:hypothetical protein